MSNIYPKRKLRDQNVLDPIELNEDLQPAASLLAGNVDAENIRGLGADGFKVAAKVADEAYYKLHKAEGVTIEPNFGGAVLVPGGTGVSQPNFLSSSGTSLFGDIEVIRNTHEWQSLSSATVTITTGTSNLWIVGWLQYVWNGFNFDAPSAEDDDAMDASQYPSQQGWHHKSNGFFPTRAQFGIRVDGRVLEWCTTGKRGTFERSPMAIKPVKSTTTAVAGLPGPRVPESRAVSMGPEVLPIRLGTVFPVEPGTHTIELVGRRLPKRKTTSYRVDDVIGVHSRELTVLEMPIHSTSNTVLELSSGSVPAFESEDVVSKTSLGESVSTLAKRFSTLQQGNIRRESLMHTQLPSKVVSVAQATINNDTLSATSHWPGLTNNETVSEDAGGWGWYQLRDESTTLQVVNTDTFEDDDIILVMANIGVRAVQPRGGENPEDFYQAFLDSFGAFRLGLKNSSTDTWALPLLNTVGHTGYVNSFNWAGIEPGFSSAAPDQSRKGKLAALDENVDVPLYALMRGSDFTSATSHTIGVFTAGMQSLPGGPNTGDDYDTASTLATPKIIWDRANLIMIHLKK